MPELQERWTRAEVLALPEDGHRYELVDGALLVTPGPRHVHQEAVRVLLERLSPHVREAGIGGVSLAPCDLALGGGHLVQPDLFVHARTPGSGPHEWSDLGIPILVVEVLSPSTARQDRTIKRLLYQRVGIAEYWIVDLDARLVERWRPDDDRPEVLADELVWHAEGAPIPWRLDLPAFFAEVWGG